MVAAQTDPRATVQGGPGNDATLRLAGDWSLAAPLPDALVLAGEVGGLGRVSRVTVDASGLGRWDSVLPAFLFELAAALKGRGVELAADGAPEGLRRLLAIAQAVPPRTTATPETRPNPIARIGLAAQSWWAALVDNVRFIGEVALALLAFLRGRAKFRTEDVARVFAAAGPQALPIVTLIGLLAGFILAFVGGNELELFGAQIYVANLVTTGMAQEMGPLMAAVIMAGRTGAAFAAELGTMQVNQETDALRTLAVEPVQYLVVPRVQAGTVMVPLLVMVFNMLGMVGAYIVAVGLQNIDRGVFIENSRWLLDPNDITQGLVKAVIFGTVQTVIACQQGYNASGGAKGVGVATTRAVVGSFVTILILDYFLTDLWLTFFSKTVSK